MLSEFRVGDKIRHSVVFKLHKIGTTSNGTVFVRGIIYDNSGMMNFISFAAQVSDFVKDLTTSTALIVYGNVQVDKYSHSGLQLMVDKVEFPNEEDDLSHLLPYTPKDIKQYTEKLEELIANLSILHWQQLAGAIFSGKTLTKFSKNPAAMRYHHAYIGGLLEHSVDVALLARSMAREIEGVDVDLVVLGALLHDIGKLQEISSALGFEYTDKGRLIGHLALGTLYVQQMVNTIPNFPTTAADDLLHIMLSHHGELEKGSPVACVTKESFIVHYADELNAVLNQFEEKEPLQNWHFSKMLGRNLKLDKKR